MKLDISKELMSQKYTNQNLQNKKIMKDAIENNEEIKRLNKSLRTKMKKSHKFRQK